MYIVSTSPLTVGQTAPYAGRLWRKLREANAAASDLALRQVWVAKVSKGLEVLSVREHHNRQMLQMLLWAQVCPGCNKEFNPLRRGKRPTFCEACRPGRRAEMFAARARRARSTSSTPAT